MNYLHIYSLINWKRSHLRSNEWHHRKELLKIQIQLKIWPELRRVRELFREASGETMSCSILFFLIFFLEGYGPLDNARTIPEWHHGIELLNIQMQLKIWPELRRVRELFRKASRGNCHVLFLFLFIFF